MIRKEYVVDTDTSNDASVEYVDYDVALTTIDNPFDPFDQFEDWFAFDTQKGYNSCNYLAKIAKLSSLMTEKEIVNELEHAIDEICAVNPFGVHRKVVKKK